MHGQQKRRRDLVFLGEVKATLSSLLKKKMEGKTKKEPTPQTF